MPSSGYTSITFVADELLTSTKMNLMGANDAAFNTGNGFNDAIIATRHFATNSVPALAIATDAIKLGVTNVTATISQSGTTPSTIASLAVTVPAGGRDLLLMITAPQILPADLTTRTEIDFKEGSTVLERYYHNTSGGGATFFCVIPAPSAGSHTYTIVSTRDSGTGAVQWYADNTASPAGPAKIQFLATLI